MTQPTTEIASTTTTTAAPVETPAGPDVAAIAAKYKRSAAKGEAKPAAVIPAAPPVEAEKAAEAAPVEAAPPDPAPPETPKQDDELSALAKATRERRLAAEEARKAKEAARSESAEIAKEREALKAAKADPIAYLKAQIADGLKIDPEAAIAFLEAAGVPPEKVAEAVVKRGTPESAAEKAAREAREEVAALKRQMEEREQRAQRALAMQRQQAAETQFLAMVKSNADKYEALNTLYEPAEVLRAAHDVVKWVQANQPGVTYDDSDIAEAIELRLKPRLASLRERFASAPKSPAPVEQKPKAQEPGPEPKPRTLTSSLSSEAAPPTEIKKLPRKDQNRHYAQLLRAAMKPSA